MFCRSVARLSKVITIPQLSPTHTQARIVKWFAAEGQRVQAYDLVLELQCSPDLVTEAFRTDNALPVMVIDTQDEGILRNIVTNNKEWMNVGTKIGIIDEEEEEDDDIQIDGTWTWQAYLKGDEGE